MAELLTVSDFSPHVGKAARFSGAPHALVIDRVIGDDSPPPPGLPRAPFIVIFRGARDGPVMAEGFYQCEIEGGPTFGLHIAPIHTPRPDRQEYQAAFN